MCETSNDRNDSQSELRQGDMAPHYAAGAGALHRERVHKRLQVLLCGVWACWAAVYILSRISGVAGIASGRAWDASVVEGLPAGLQVLIWWRESAVRSDSVFAFYLVGALMLWMARGPSVSRRALVAFAGAFLALGLFDVGSTLILSQYSDVLMGVVTKAALTAGASHGVSYSLNESTVVGSIIVYAPLLCFCVLLAVEIWGQPKKVIDPKGHKRSL